MLLGDMLYRLYCQEAAKRQAKNKQMKRLVKPFKIGKSGGGLVAIPNKIRKRFGNASR